MSKQKKLLGSQSESRVKINLNVTSQEIRERQNDYKKKMDKVKFAKKYSHSPFEKQIIKIDGKEYDIQINFCIDPFCKWFGIEQKKYEDIKHKPSRYKIAGAFDEKQLRCNDVDDNNIAGHVTESRTALFSNWSMASEIKRLIDVNTIVDIEPNYTFHKEDCIYQDNTPFENPKEFHRRGKSSSGSQKYMCKYCRKMTNILPEQEESFNYNQKRNDILVGMVKEVIGRSPVKKTMDRTNIGASTYYNKVEIIYKRCLAFLERHETKPLKKKQFNTLWLQTDKFSYYLNNIRKKGCSSAKGVRENALFNTLIVATVDSYSNYIFRSDLAYDYMLNYEDLLGDIIVYREDQIYKYAQKNAKYRYLYYGSRYDKEDNSDKINVNNIQDRKNYVDGFHVNSSYTAYAQYWLIKNMLNAKHINYVTDNDTSLTGAIIRAIFTPIIILNMHIN